MPTLRIALPVHIFIYDIYCNLLKSEHIDITIFGLNLPSQLHFQICNSPHNKLMSHRFKRDSANAISEGVASDSGSASGERWSGINGKTTRHKSVWQLVAANSL